MSSPEEDHFAPTADSILHDMFTTAVGPDNPMTPEAREAGYEAVQLRIARAVEILEGDSFREGEEYDSQAMTAVFLIQDERKKVEDRRKKICEFPEAAAGYWSFLIVELTETLGASSFSMLFPAPEEVTKEELDLIVEELQSGNWIAEVAHIDPEDEESPLGVKIVSHIE